MKNFSKVSVAQDARTELHDKLSLTGAEISINNLPAGASVPFVHSHKKMKKYMLSLQEKAKLSLMMRALSLLLEIGCVFPLLEKDNSSLPKIPQ